MFSSLGTYWNSVVVKPLMHYFTLPKYFFICYSLTSHISFTWPITSYESPRTRTESAPSDLANSKPCSRASYSASLLVIWNCRWTTYSRWSPSSDRNTILIPPTCCVDKPFTRTTHRFAPWSPFYWSWVWVNLAMKSASTWAFIASLGWYLMSNSLSSTTYWINCPAASNLFIAFFNE